MYDVIVIGAGPAGIMASIKASSNNKVLLIEKNDKIGCKLALTGGGRCNLTNLKKNADFLKEIPVNSKALEVCMNKFGPSIIYKYFEDLGVPLKTEENDRVFPKSDKASSIINILYQQLISSKVTINYKESVVDINIKNSYKEVITNKGIYKTKNIIIATGGCSYPHTGSTGDGYKLAKILKQPLIEIYPAETFLITTSSLQLQGITLPDVKITFYKTVSGSLLFTHTGLSGPSVFKISEEVYKYLKEHNNATISIDLLPKYSSDEMLLKILNYNQKKEIKSFIKEFFPKRLVDYIIKINNINENIKIASISKNNVLKLIDSIKFFKVDIKRTGKLEESFVTGGGVDFKNINSNTMESTINKGIYFVGELLDVHGHTGGYNITIALSTGYLAGTSIKENKD